MHCLAGLADGSFARARTKFQSCFLFYALAHHRRSCFGSEKCDIPNLKIGGSKLFGSKIGFAKMTSKENLNMHQ